MAGAERTRVEGFGHLENGLRQAGDWYRWGPYLSERQWGTVREDYSADGDAWSYFPHDHARSRAYRWGEDGMAGFCDIEQRLCLSLALWNGERPDPQGADVRAHRRRRPTTARTSRSTGGTSTPFPATPGTAGATTTRRRAFPYDDLIAENGRRGKLDPEYELLDTGVFDDDRYWIVEVDYVKADPDDLIMVVRVTNAGPGRRRRCTCCRRRGSATRGAGTSTRPKPGLARGARRRRRDRPPVPAASSSCWPGRARTARRRRRCSARTRPTTAACTAPTPAPPYPKDGINDHVVDGRGHRQPGPGAAPRWRSGTRSRSPPGATVELRLRLRPAGAKPAGSRRRRSASDVDAVVALRRKRGRRVLRRADPGRPLGRRGGGHAPGVRRDAVEQAAVRLRRAALAGRRPDPADAAGRSADRAQLALDELRRLRHHVDARQVGVPVVRRLGPRLPLRRPGPRRPGVRQVPAAADLPGVVPAPERRPARLRVGLRRRQPAGAGVGGARGVRHRRRPRPRLPQPACSTSCWSTSRGG